MNMINQRPDYQCGQCKAVNQHKFVYRNISQYVVCIKCGHEKLKQSITSTEPTLYIPKIIF